MKKLILSLLVAVGLIGNSANAQNQSSRCQEADKQLNQAYQQLKSSLTDQQKVQLKQQQRAWIVQRDAIIAKSADKEEAFYQTTIQRIGELQQNTSPTPESSRSQTDTVVENSTTVPQHSEAPEPTPQSTPFVFKEDPNYKYVLIGPKIKGLSIGMRFQDAVLTLKEKLKGKTSDVGGIAYDVLGPFDADQGPLADVNRLASISAKIPNGPYATTFPPLSTPAGAIAGGAIIRADNNNAVCLISITGSLTKVLFEGASSLSFDDFLNQFMKAYGIPKFTPNEEGDAYEYRDDNGGNVKISKDFTIQMEKINSKKDVQKAFD